MAQKLPISIQVFFSFVNIEKGEKKKRKKNTMGHVLNPIWTSLPQITVLCDVCRVEETTARLVYCDSFLSITQQQRKFDFYQDERSKGETTKTSDDCKKIYTRLVEKLHT